MSKATIEFDLTDSDDRIEYARVNKSLDMALCLWQILYNTKKQLQWDVEKKQIANEDVIEMVFDKIHQIVEEHHIIIDELVV